MVRKAEETLEEARLDGKQRVSRAMGSRLVFILRANRKSSICFKQDAVTSSKVNFWKILSAVERTKRERSQSGWNICTGLG